MGIIYKLTSPDDEEYVGQTKNALRTRLSQHSSMAASEHAGCPLLSESLLKYGGMQFFTATILLECDDAQLNDEEIKAIRDEDTLYPNGLNISPGGGVGPRSELCKSFSNEEGLPMFVIKVIEDDHQRGYRVCNHPKGPEKRFLSKDMADNLKRALSYKCFLDSLTERLEIVKPSKETYIQKYKEGFCVKIPGNKPRHFVRGDDSNYERASKYFADVMSGNLDDDAQYLRKIKGGYRVKFPNYPDKHFVSSNQAENERKAQEYLEDLKDGKISLIKEFPKEEYVTKHKNGFRVKLPGQKIAYFNSARNTVQKNYDDAVEYKKSNIDIHENDVQRS